MFTLCGNLFFQTRKSKSETVFEVRTKMLGNVPIVDFYPVDYGLPHQAFGFEVGPVCFKWLWIPQLQTDIWKMTKREMMWTHTKWCAMCGQMSYVEENDVCIPIAYINVKKEVYKYKMLIISVCFHNRSSKNILFTSARYLDNKLYTHHSYHVV